MLIKKKTWLIKANYSGNRAVQPHAKLHQTTSTIKNIYTVAEVVILFDVSTHKHENENQQSNKKNNIKLTAHVYLPLNDILIASMTTTWSID